jgi:uncharacterized membrane protein
MNPWAQIGTLFGWVVLSISWVVVAVLALVAIVFLVVLIAAAVRTVGQYTAKTRSTSKTIISRKLVPPLEDHDANGGKR